MVALLQPWSQNVGMVAGMARRQPADEEWVLLSYWLPREPSTPRSSVWRRLNRLGVAKLADGLVALPADARTREALEWVADQVIEHSGQAMLWLGRPADRAGLEQITSRMTAAVSAEYAAVAAEAEQVEETDPAARRRVAARLNRELRRIAERDFFTAPGAAGARHAVAKLARTVAHR